MNWSVTDTDKKMRRIIHTSAYFSTVIDAYEESVSVYSLIRYQRQVKRGLVTRILSDT